MKTMLVCIALGALMLTVASAAWAQRGAAARGAEAKPKERFPEAPVPDNVTLVNDVTYGTGGGRELKLFLFLPKDERESHPGIVFFHGGGWTGGSPKQFFRQAGYLASKGYVAACAEYRLSGEAKFPAAAEDVKCSVRWMRANAKRYKIDPNRIASGGGSAGAHLAAMLGVMDKGDGLDGTGGQAEYSSKANAVVAFNGAFDLPRLAERMKPVSEQTGKPIAPVRFLGGTLEEIPEAYKKASPMTYVSEGDAAFLFLHGTKDQVVPLEESVRMKEALEKVGARAEIFAAERAAHGFFNNPPWYEPTLKRMEEFLNDVFGMGEEKGGPPAEKTQD